MVVVGLVSHVWGAGDIGFNLAAPGLLWIVAIAVLTFTPGGIFEIERSRCRLALFNRLVFTLLAPTPALHSRAIAPGHRPPRANLAT